MIAALCACVLLALGLRRRRQPGGPGLVLLSIGLVVWTATIAVQTLSASRSIKDLLLSVTFTAVAAVTIGSWWSITDLTRRPRMNTARWVLALAPVLVLLGLVWTRAGDLMFRQVLIPDGQGPVDNVPGPCYPVFILWVYAVLGASLVLFARAAIRSGGRYRPQGVLLVAVISLPLLANVLSVTRVYGFGGYDATPVTLVVTLVGIVWGIRRLGLFDVQIGLLPVAPQVVVEAMRDGVAVVDGQGRVLDLNPAASELLGLSSEIDFGVSADDVIPGWAQSARGRWEVSHRDRVLELSATIIDPDDPRVSRVVIIRDVTDRHAAEVALAESARLHRHQSRHDPLTGLANRTLLFERLHEVLEAPTPDRVPRLALMILDLDGFKELNDGFGHRAGDRALCEVADRLTGVAGAAVMVARLGGDEFAIAIPGGDADAAQHLAARLEDSLASPFNVGGVAVRLGGSLGIACSPDHGVDADELVHAADVAMYHAKRAAAGVAVYSVDGDPRRTDRILLRHELRAAISDGQLEVHYQPLLAADTHQLAAVEALVRWRHPDRGLLLPRDFLSIASENDVVLDITDFVLDHAIRDAAHWAREGRGRRVAVNVSHRDLTDPRLPERVTALLARHAPPRRTLVLEITEDALATTPEAADRLNELRAAGVLISLDDFGTGLSPLSTLRTMPVDEIKIDRSFVRQIDRIERDAALAGALVRLGHDLNLQVVAEGVETPEQARILTGLGCDMLQGYLFGKPRPLIDRGERDHVAATAAWQSAD